MKRIIDIRPPQRATPMRPAATPKPLPDLSEKASRIGARRTLRHGHDYTLDPFPNSTPALPQRKPWQTRAQKLGRVIPTRHPLELGRVIPTRHPLELGRMALVGFTMVILLNGINVYYRGLAVKQHVAGAAYDTYEQFMAGGVNEDSLNQVHSALEDVQHELWFLQNQRQTAWSDRDATQAVDQILNAGSTLTESGTGLLTFVEESKIVLSHLLEEKPAETAVGDSLTEAWNATYTEDFLPALTALNEATVALNAVNSAVLPDTLRMSFETMVDELGSVHTALNIFNEHFSTLLHLLGDEHPQRYLVLLQNNHESRPGGGFIGSYLIVDVNDGYLDNMTFHDVYELDGQYHEFIEPPAEIAKLTNEWRFRDSNYSPDMSVSSAKAAWFLEEEGGPGVDHVITVDLTFVTELLAVLGPIQVDSLAQPLDATNFTTVLSYLVESKWSGTQTPKAILGEFVTQATQTLREQKPWDALSQLFQTMARDKHVSAYSTHEGVQAFFADFGVSGVVEAPSEGEDALMVVHTSIGGNKTDAWVNEALQHDTYLSEDGTVTNRLTLTRTHTWTEADEVELIQRLGAFGFSTPEPWLIDLLGRGPNASAFRIYVPRGSVLLSAEGLDIAGIERRYDIDLGMDYFSFNQTVYAGTAETIVLTYRLPTTLTFSPLAEYRLAVFKQPGASAASFTKTIQADGTMNQVRSFPEELLENAHEEVLGVYTWSTSLDKDLHLAQLWGK